MKETILSIAGKPGLYKLISRGNNSLIVESLDAAHRRMPAFGTDRITSLSDIAMFTDADDIPLMDVMESLKTLEGGKKSTFDYKKANGAQLQASYQSATVIEKGSELNSLKSYSFFITI